MQTEGYISSMGKFTSHVGLPPQIENTRSKQEKSSRTCINKTVKFVSSKRSTTILSDKPHRASEDYIRRLNIGLNFTPDVVTESAPSSLRYDQVKQNIFKIPKDLTMTRSLKLKGELGRHNAIGDPVPHLPCTLPVSAHNAELRRTRSFAAKPFLKKCVQKEESVAAQASEVSSAAQWDEFVLNKLSHDTADFIVNKHAHGSQRDRLQQKVLSDSKEVTPSVVFKESQHMDVEPIIVDRKHDIEQSVSEKSIFMLTETRDVLMTNNVTEKCKETTPVAQEEYIPKYLGKPLQRNYMEKFMTKAQRKREIAYDPEQEKYIGSNYNRNKLMSDNEQFTDDILQGRFSIHNPGNQSKIVFDTHTQYKKNLISCYPNKPTIWGPALPRKQGRVVPTRGHRPWKEYPKLIITTYQRQVLSSTSDTDSRTTPGILGMDSLYDSDELTHSLLLKALGTWRTTWYLDNKWRDGSLDNILMDMQDISEHVRITAAIACGAALGYRDDWDLDEKSEASESPGKDVTMSGYRAYSPSARAESNQRSAGQNVVDHVIKLLVDTSERVRVAAAVTLLAVGASNQRAKQVLLHALHKPGTMPADSWAAVQCLAMENVTERVVIDKLIERTQSADNLVRITATKLLVRLSIYSDVILYIVADELNNKLWINRYMACKVMQKIQTPLNKDILHKLLTVMWSDYSEHVKSVAAQTIGVKGYGHVLHDELCCRLRNGNEHERVDALKRIIELQMMTGRMKSVFLKCFTDDHVSVRFTAAKGAGELKFADDDAIEGLLSLISDDHSHKVKAAAIEALADIGVRSDKIRTQLVWSAQYQQDAQVRSAACLVLAMLKFDTDDVVNTLRDRLTADADNIVKKASTQALQILGRKPEKDASLILAIKDAVKKLGSKDAILAAIINSENSTCDVVGSRNSTSHSAVVSPRQIRSRPETTKSDGQRLTGHMWPEAVKVIDHKTKKDKIQALLAAHEDDAPTTKFLWRKDTST